MTPSQFKTKWGRYQGKETSAYQEHFNDLCRMLGQKSPVEADPTGADWFCFQKRVIKDLEYVPTDESKRGADKPRKGFADVWRKGNFGWEYKGKHDNLAKAYQQLLQYRESLLNPPLLVTCDFARFVIKTNFNGTVTETHEIQNEEIDAPENLRILRALFENPELLRPAQTTAEVTEKLAGQIAAIALSLQAREASELADARNRREVTVAHKKNLRIARFLNRIIFCLFAEDTNLLPRKLVLEIFERSENEPIYFAPALESLFRTMAKGGLYGPHQVRHFNGHLFEDTSVFELLPDEIQQLAKAAKADWHSIQPSIMGTLFERALDSDQRAELGAHYTSEEDITTLIEPVLMSPLRAEWQGLRKKLSPAFLRGKAKPAERVQLRAFQRQVASVSVLDPACGSGNFLYVALRLLMDLEKEVVTFAAAVDFSLPLKVDVTQLRAIEINPYAYELAQVSVQIGALQWRRENGYENDRTPVLRTLEGFENKDALLRETFRKQPRNLKEARSEEHHSQVEIFRVFHERAWPDADVIVGNPPFLGDKLMRRELGDEYVEELRRIYGNRIPGQSDLCCYWFEKARAQIEERRSKRAGLLATQSIRGGANGEVLRRIKQSGDIFFAISDREWILAGAAVHVAMVGFDDGSEEQRSLNGQPRPEISASLSDFVAFDRKQILKSNAGVAFIGTMKKGPLEITADLAEEMLADPNPTGKPNSDVIRRWISGRDISVRDRNLWIIDFPMSLSEEESAGYARPFAHVRDQVGEKRANHREAVQQKYWWRMARPSPDMRRAISPLRRFAATQAVGKHRYFVWVDSYAVPDQQAIVFATEEDWVLGVLSSRYHELWVREAGKQLREAESGGRYNVVPCFETFPFPLPLGQPSEPRLEAIAQAAQELSSLRSRWLNPPDWTHEEILQFKATVGGPWDRFIDQSSVRNGIGIAHLPRIVPNDKKSSAALAGRSMTELYNEKPRWLRFAHEALDSAVAAAYGFPAGSSDDEILDRLLSLNLEHSAAEKRKAASQSPRRQAQRERNADEML